MIGLDFIQPLNVCDSLSFAFSTFKCVWHFKFCVSALVNWYTGDELGQCSKLGQCSILIILPVEVFLLFRVYKILAIVLFLMQVFFKQILL